MTGPKRQILFVDDDRSIINGIRRSALSYDDNWDLYFALSGQEALNILATTRIDLLVTDMRMPGMDGIEFLEKVTQQFPEVVRFVLSGNSEFSRMLQSTQLAHQFLAKPCEFAQLHRTIEQTCRMRDLLNDPQMIRLTTGSVRLPSMPQLYFQLVQELKSEEPNPKRVAEIIGQDVSMTAKILQLVNSAFFSLPSQVSSPQRAVTILGTNTIRSLVLGIHVFSEFQSYASPLFSIDALWNHSLLVGRLMRRLAQDVRMPAALLEDCQVIGLLHDVGKLIQLRIPNFFPRCKFEHGFITLESEMQLLGTTHAQLGAYLLAIWGLPNQVVEAAAYHHDLSSLVKEGINLATLLHVANGLHYLTVINQPNQYHLALDLPHLEKLGLLNRLDNWTGICQQMTLAPD